MKFLHLSTGDVRGAFSAAYRLHRNLLQGGHESRMLVGYKHTSDPTVLAPPRIVQVFQRVAMHVGGNQALRAVCGPDIQARHSLTFNLGLSSAGSLVRLLDGFRPDLIVTHYTSGFLSPSNVLEIGVALDAPTAIYLMDMEMLTGACHYAWDCNGYASGCEDCPAVPGGLLKNWVRKQSLQRRSSLAQAGAVVVACSSWLMRQAESSAITRDLERRHIYLGIDSQLHAPQDKQELRRKFGLPGDALILYFGAQNLDDPRKGFEHLRSALRQLALALDPSERSKVVLFTVGQASPEAMGVLPFNHVHHAYISDAALFAATYAASDLFICPSVEDSGPMMINESIVSGTPVAAFEMGVAIDLVIPGKTGFRVALGDSSALAASLAEFVRLPASQRAAMSSACRALGLSKSSVEVQVRDFVELAQAIGARRARRLP